jgi:hypothetical protein
VRTIGQEGFARTLTCKPRQPVRIRRFFCPWIPHNLHRFFPVIYVNPRNPRMNIDHII